MIDRQYVIKATGVLGQLYISVTLCEGAEQHYAPVMTKTIYVDYEVDGDVVRDLDAVCRAVSGALARP